MSSTTPITRTILRTRSDWIDWIPVIESTAEDYWPFWDPYNKAKKEPPKAPAFPKKRRVPITQTTSSASSTETQSPTAEANTYELAPPLPSDYEDYKVRLHAYERYTTKANAVRLEIMNSVSSQIKRDLKSLPSRELSTWMDYLLEHYEEDTRATESKVEADYQKLLRTFKSRKIEEWTVEWSGALADAGRLELPVAQRGRWLEDLYHIIDKNYPITAAQLALAIGQRTAKDIKVTSAHRWVTMLVEEQQIAERGKTLVSRPVRGSAFATLESEGSGSDTASSNPSRQKRPRATTQGGQRPVKRSNNNHYDDKQQPDRLAKKCSACFSMGHEWEECWGLFPELSNGRMSNGQARRLKEITDTAMKADPGLKRSVEEKKRERAAH